MRKVLVCLLLAALALPARAQPKFPPPTLRSALADNLVAKARVRWIKAQASAPGQHVEISIGGGVAERRSEGWSPQPSRLKYDIDRNRALEAAIKAAARTLGPSQSGGGPAGEAHPASPGEGGGAKAQPPLIDERTLELVARGPDGWVTVGHWTLPRARWQKRYPALYRQLEPLFDAPAETFVPVQSQSPPR